MPYVLDPMYVPEPGGGIISENAPWFDYMNPVKTPKWSGKACLVQALDQNIILDLTAPVGTWTGMYYSLMAQLGNWEFNVRKVDESIEVSPMYKGFYEMVMGERQNIEIKVKKVIDDIITHSSDLELLKHDFRRYKEFYEYFDFDMKKGKPDEHSLKAVFIDMVDYHTGEGAPGRLSMVAMQMNNIFPTIIQDFYQMEKLEDLQEKDRLKNLPNVEKDMLKTKWLAYQEWKNLFGSEVRSRYSRLKELIESKSNMLEKSKEWIKPYMARYKMLKEGFSSEKFRTDRLVNPFGPSSQPTSATSITVWAWKEFPVPEAHKASGELLALKEDIAKFIKVDKDRAILEDKWTKENLLLSPKTGLRSKYDFVDSDWIEEKITDIYMKDDWFKARKRINRTYLYYAFLEINFTIWTTRTPTGIELEDINITVRAYWMSRNVLLTKLFEIKAMQEEFENDLDRMLGINIQEKYQAKKDEKTLSEIVRKSGFGDSMANSLSRKIRDDFSSLQSCFEVCKRNPVLLEGSFRSILSEKDEKKFIDSMKAILSKKSKPESDEKSKGMLDSVKSFLGFFDMGFDLFRSGPYEKTFKTRITKFYLTNLGKIYFGPVVKHIKGQMLR